MATILITGSARGIGNALVRAALARGDTVLAGVRKPEDRDKFPASDRLHLVVMDVADSASVEKGFADADAALAGKPLDAVINLAAIAPPGAIELMPLSEYEHIFNTNYFGSLRVLKAALPRLRTSRGKMILVTSLWGQAAGAMLSAYCGTKHAIEVLGDVARRETRGMGVDIVVAEPGVVLTEMYGGNIPATEKALATMSESDKALYGPLYTGYLKAVKDGGKAAITAEKAAAEFLKIVDAAKPRTRYRFGMDSKVVCFLAWLLPDRWMDAVFAASFKVK